MDSSRATTAELRRGRKESSSTRKACGHEIDRLHTTCIFRGNSKLWSITGHRQQFPRQACHSPPQQRREASRRFDIHFETGAALRLLGILAPALDLEAFLEFSGGEGAIGVEPAFDEGEADDERAGAARRRMERGEMHL